MKKFVLFFFLAFITAPVSSQINYGGINFDDGTNLFRIYIDSSGPGNI